MRYVIGIWSARYFWVHLALADMRARWRRSYLGPVWSVLQPLGMTALIAFVLGRLMKIDVIDFAPYILSGIIFWEYISATANSGSVAFIQNEPYIKQYRHPLAIYTLRTAFGNLLVFVLASVALFGWVLVFRPHNLGWSWLSWPLCVPMMLLVAWPLATLLAYATVRFRDIPHALGLILQAAWFVSPIYFETKFFRDSGLSGLVDYNPLYHLLQTIRAPLLYGEWPTPTNYAYCIGTFLVLTAVSIVMGWHYERKVIFYL